MTSGRVTYSRSVLLALRSEATSHKLTRLARRSLWFYGILEPKHSRRPLSRYLPPTPTAPTHPPRSPISSLHLSHSFSPIPHNDDRYDQPIPIRTTNRQHASIVRSSYHSSRADHQHNDSRQLRRSSCLRFIHPVTIQRPRKVVTLEQPSVLMMNARSIRNKLDELRLRIDDKQPDLVIINETWLDDSIDSSFLRVPKYDLLRKDRDQMGGGLLVYYRELHRLLPCTCLKLNLPNCKSELLWFILRPGIMVISIYHPYWGSSPQHSDVIDALLDIVSHGRSAHSVKHVLICGDFNGLSDNIPTINSLLGTECLFQFPTRGSAQLDFALSDSKNAYLKSQLLPPLGRSDHFVIFCPSTSVKPRPSTKKIKFRPKTPAACASFHSTLIKDDFLSDVLEQHDVNKATSMFLDSLYALFDFHFPSRTIRLRSDDKPWVRPSLKHLINKRDRAFNEGKTLKYLRLRESVILHVQKLKKNFIKNAIDTRNSSTLWRSINCLLSRSKLSATSAEPQDLKNYFSSVFVTPDDTSTIPGDVMASDLPSSPLLVTLHDVHSTMRTLRKGSPGPDGIPFWIFKDYCDLLAPAVHHICKLSFSLCIFPDSLKTSFVVPIPKCVKPSLSDFRPISLLPVLSKVIEKIVLRKWFSSIIPKIRANQFAFVPRLGQGTVSALTFIVNRILSFIDQPGAVRCLMIDYSKAFDKIPHKTILNSLTSFKCPKELLSWLSSYLQSRTQRVKVNGNLSDGYEATSGVPQGGVLSPILFALTVDSLKPRFENSCIVKFADDMCLLHFIRDGNGDFLADELQHIITWSSEKGLHFNNDKTKLMTFNTRRSLSLPPLNDPRSGTPISTVTEAKLLGLIIDDDLSWEKNTSTVLKKIRKRVYMLYALRQAKAPKFVIWDVYCAMLRSIASYAYPAWCNISKGRLQKITKFEDRLCKIFDLHDERKSTFPVFCETLAQRLAKKALDSHHPLHVIYDTTATRYSHRLGKHHRRLKAKTKRYHHSFVRFAQT